MELPIVTAPPDVLVEILSAPVVLFINESVPLCDKVISLLVPKLIVSLSLSSKDEALNLPVTVTCLLPATLFPEISKMVSLNSPWEVWSLANLKLPY